jgi:hypothetical protein
VVQYARQLFHFGWNEEPRCQNLRTGAKFTDPLVASCRRPIIVNEEDARFRKPMQGPNNAFLHRFLASRYRGHIYDKSSAKGRFHTIGNVRDDSCC